MARESDGSDAVGASTVDEQARAAVRWAGLPVDLDFAFSRDQCDKVYQQHLMRKREIQRASAESRLPVDGHDDGAVHAVV